MSSTSNNKGGSNVEDDGDDGNVENTRQNNSYSTTILLKLNPDGTFKQCNEGYTEGRWISGRWKVEFVTDDDSCAINTNNNDHNDEHIRRKTTTSQQRQRLTLAMNRQYFGPSFDLVLDGYCQYYDDDDDLSSSSSSSQNSKNSLENKDSIQLPTPLCVEGTIQKGKYLHPQRHPSFFESPMLANSAVLGPFTLEQSLSIRSILGDGKNTDENDMSNVLDLNGSSGYTKHVDDESTPKEILTSSFHDKRFLLTVEPIRDYDENRPVDIRSMPIDFFTNHTFAAYGNNKILRGRYEVKRTIHSSDDGRTTTSSSATMTYQLYMDVSLFGAGRSAPGSVYSEGIGLTHDDEQSFIGEVQWERQAASKSKSKPTSTSSNGSSTDLLLFVHGTAFYGTDLGEDARPEPCGKFTLVQDTTTSSMKDDGDDDKRQTDLDEDDDRSNNNNNNNNNGNSYIYCGGVFE